MPRSPSIGIDFADDKIRIVRMRFEPFAYIEGVDELSLPGYLSDDHLVFDTKSLHQVLKKVSSDTPRDARCVFSMPNACTNFTWMRMQKMEPRELREVARYRVRRGDDDVERLAVAVMESVADEKLVVSSSAEVLNQRKEILDKAGFQVVGAESQSQSILRSTGQSMALEASLANTASMTIAHITEGRTNVVVVQNGRLNFARSSRIGYSGLLAKAAETLAISPQEIDPILFCRTAEMGSDFQCRVIYQDRAFMVDMTQPMNAFVKEFRRVQNYFRSLHPERSFSGMIDRLVISGLPTLTTGFASTLSRALALRISSHRPTWRIPIIADNDTVETLSMRHPSYAVPIGLALAPYGTVVEQPRTEEAFVWNLRAA